MPAPAAAAAAATAARLPQLRLAARPAAVDAAVSPAPALAALCCCDDVGGCCCCCCSNCCSSKCSTPASCSLLPKLRCIPPEAAAAAAAADPKPGPGASCWDCPGTPLLLLPLRGPAAPCVLAMLLAESDTCMPPAPPPSMAPAARELLPAPWGPPSSPAPCVPPARPAPPSISSFCRASPPPAGAPLSSSTGSCSSQVFKQAGCRLEYKNTLQRLTRDAGKQVLQSTSSVHMGVCVLLLYSFAHDLQVCVCYILYSCLRTRLGRSVRLPRGKPPP